VLAGALHMTRQIKQIEIFANSTWCSCDFFSFAVALGTVLRFSGYAFNLRMFAIVFYGQIRQFYYAMTIQALHLYSVSLTVTIGT
jgi:hypothetical protein